MINEIYIYHHLGLGDHIICNGLVREYAKRYNKVYLFCKPHNIQSVAAMYSDINIECISASDTDAQLFIQNHPSKQYLIVGFNKMNTIVPFDKQFYDIANLPFETRWSSFHCPRSTTEVKLYNAQCITHPYAVIHEDTNRGYCIAHKYIKLPKISIIPQAGYNLCDYRVLLELATEIHVIDSSVMFFVDSLPDLAKHKLFIHRYARSNLSFHIPVLKHNWTILE